jgi:hypothetical protein
MLFSLNVHCVSEILLVQLLIVNIFLDLNTGQFKKKVTLPHVYNEVTSEPTITRYTTIVRKTLEVCF